MYPLVLFMPHPPILLPAIGKEECSKALCTIEGMHILAKKVAQYKPETIIFITPHGNSFSNGTCILDDEEVRGDFGNFSHPEIRFVKKINRTLSKAIYDQFEEAGNTCVLMDEELAKRYHVSIQLDHGVLVPMYFIDQEYKEYEIVHITPGQTPLEENYLLGKVIKKVVESSVSNSPSGVLVLCSGDLSHALSDEGPYVFHESGPYFDQEVKKILEQNRPIDFFRLSKKKIQEASQCGLRSYVMGFGYADGLLTHTKVVSYEGPFGVGYLTGYIESEEWMTSASDDVPSVVATIFDYLKEEYNRRIAKEDDYIRLARKSIEAYVTTGRILEADETDFSEAFLRESKGKKKGVFVSIHKDEQLRGCIGTIEASSNSVFEEIIYNAVSACSQDPRFHPIEEEELRDLVISVDVLEEAEPIASYTELDPKNYGVIVTQGYKRGLLLPNLPGITDVYMQLDIAKQKAGITGGKVDLARFLVTRHEIDE